MWCGCGECRACGWLWISGMRGVGGVCEMCMYLAQGGMGG